MPTFAIGLIALSIAPFAIYLTLKRPLLFPFGLYVMLVPFDVLIAASGGSATILTRIVAITSGAALLFNMIATRRILAPPKSWAAWAAYVLLACLSALWTIDAAGSTLIIGMLLEQFLLFSILAVYPASHRDVRILGGIIVASGTCLSAVGLISYAMGIRSGEDRLAVSLNGIYLDPNHYAASLLMPIAIAVGALLETRDVRIRFCAGLATVAMIATLFLTGSRGGLIALSIMLLYIAWKTRYRFQVLALMTLGGVASLLQPTVWNRFADKGLAGGSGRLSIWSVGGSAFKDHWLTGAGIGAFPSAYNHSLQVATYQPIFQGWSRPAHNSYLNAAVELGILGLALLVYAWWRSWNDSSGNAVIEASIVGIAVASYFLDVLVFKYVWLAFSMAVLVRNAAQPKFLRGSSRRQQTATNAKSEQPNPTWRSRRAAMLLANRASGIRKPELTINP